MHNTLKHAWYLFVTKSPWDGIVQWVVWIWLVLCYGIIVTRDGNLLQVDRHRLWRLRLDWNHSEAPVQQLEARFFFKWQIKRIKGKQSGWGEMTAEFFPLAMLQLSQPPACIILLEELHFEAATACVFRCAAKQFPDTDATAIQAPGDEALWILLKVCLKFIFYAANVLWWQQNLVIRHIRSTPLLVIRNTWHQTWWLDLVIAFHTTPTRDEMKLVSVQWWKKLEP